MAIETAIQINEEVAGIVGDSFIGITDTISYINKGLKEISGLVLLPKLLETETTIDTVVSTAYASLPADFQKNLHYCYSDTNSTKIKIYGSVELLYSAFSRLDVGGRVVGVARRGDRLYYQRIPSSVETLRIHYYKYPTVITTGSDSPDCLPEFIVRPLLVNYICKEIFALSKQSPDIEYHETKYMDALALLIKYIGPEARESQKINDELNLENYL